MTSAGPIHYGVGDITLCNLAEIAYPAENRGVDIRHIEMPLCRVKSEAEEQRPPCDCWCGPSVAYLCGCVVTLVALL